MRWFSGAAASAGIACIVVAMVLLSLQDSVVKWLGASYPLHQIVLIRSLIASGLIVIVLIASARLADLRTRRWALHATRGLLLVLTNSLFFFALIAMPMAEAVALFFVAPLFITLLSATILGEKVGPRRLTAVLVGFVGVVIVVRPGSAAFSYIALVPVAAAALYAILQILTRHLGSTDSTAAMSFNVHLALIAASIAMGLAVGDGRFAGSGDPSMEFLLRAWRWPGELDAPLFAAVGVLIAAASVLLVQAYRTTEAATIAPFEYVALPCATLWGFLLWGEVPDAIAFTGMALIVASGVFIILRTERLQSAARPTAPSD